jgi:hypothetical protein
MRKALVEALEDVSRTLTGMFDFCNTRPDRREKIKDCCRAAPIYRSKDGNAGKIPVEYS